MAGLVPAIFVFCEGVVPAKAGTTAEFVAALSLQSNCQTANAARAGLARFAPRQASSPILLAAPGTPSPEFQPPHLEKDRGRAERQGPRGPTVPRRLATSRLVESIVPQVRQVSGVPRAMFEVCSASSPAVDLSDASTLTSIATSLPLRALALDRRPLIRAPAPAVRGPRRAAGAPERSGLDRRLGQWRRISDAPNRPPLPAPRLETLDQTPLGNEAGWR